MSIISAYIAISPIISLIAIPSKLIINLVAFTKYQNLVLRTLDLNLCNYIITHIVKTL